MKIAELFYVDFALQKWHKSGVFSNILPNYAKAITPLGSDCLSPFSGSGSKTQKPSAQCQTKSQRKYDILKIRQSTTSLNLEGVKNYSNDILS